MHNMCKTSELPIFSIICILKHSLGILAISSTL